MERRKTRSAKKITAAVKKIVGAGLASSRRRGRPTTKDRPSLQSFNQEELNRRIQEKAYELYLKRGAAHGDDKADWLEAEQIVRGEISRN